MAVAVPAGASPAPLDIGSTRILPPTRSPPPRVDAARLLAPPVHRSTLSPFLFDRRFWADRLAQVDHSRVDLTVRRRTPCDGARSCVEELSVAHADGRLRALFVRPLAAPPRALTVVVAHTSGRARAEPDEPLSWPNLVQVARRAQSGRALLLVPQDVLRRLEDRVLDLIVVLDRVRKSAALPVNAIEFETHDDADVVEIARTLIEKRWV